MLTHREMLERNVEFRGDNVALKIPSTGETVTYTEFDRQVNSLANAFRDRGIREGDRVPLVLFNTVEFPLTLFACYKIAAVPVPLNFMLASDNFTHIFDDIGPAMVVYDGKVADDVETGLDNAIRSANRVRVGSTPEEGESFEGVFESGNDGTPPEVPQRPESISYMLYTSGTTGMPKGVTFTQESAYHRILEMTSTMNVSQDTVALQFSPWFHAGGIGTTVHPVLCTGGTLLVTSDWEPETVADIIDEHEVTYTVGVPTVARRIANMDDVDTYDLSTIENLVCMGAPLSRALANNIIERITPNLYNVYGTTETLGDILLRPEDLPEQAGTAGRPFLDKQIRVIEYGAGEEFSPDDRADVGEEGQIIIKGEGNIDYYFGNHEATEAAFEDGWYYPSDLGRKNEDGYITITGRADDMILSGGELISPVEVEERLEEYDGVDTAVVVGTPDEEWGERVKAFVVAEGVTGDDLEAYCKNHDGLADYKRPREYEFVDSIERTATGKKQRYKYRTD